jgi:hypothetical protein
MPAIRDVAGLRGAFGSSLCKRFAPVAADDLNARMRAEPVAERLFGALGQQVNRSTALQIAEDRPVREPFAKGKVVDAQHAHRRTVVVAMAVKNSQQPVAADRHAEAAGESAAGSPPHATASARNVSSRRWVRRDLDAATSGNCSVKIRCEQVG